MVFQQSDCIAGLSNYIGCLITYLTTSAVAEGSGVVDFCCMAKANTCSPHSRTIRHLDGIKM